MVRLTYTEIAYDQEPRIERIAASFGELERNPEDAADL
jgi:hypothetical protein